MGVFYRPPGLSSTMELPFTILQKVKKFYKPDHPTIPHHLLMDLLWFDLLSLNSPSIPTVPYGPYCSYTVPDHPYATPPWVYAWSIRYSPLTYACLCRVSLGLMSKDLCVKADMTSMIYYHQASDRRPIDIQKI